MKKLSLLIVLVFFGCTDMATQEEVDKLRTKIEALQSEHGYLRGELLENKVIDESEMLRRGSKAISLRELKKTQDDILDYFGIQYARYEYKGEDFLTKDVKKTKCIKLKRKK